MTRSLKSLMVTLLVTSGIIATGGAASADAAEDYRAAMDPFANEITAWHNQTAALIAATAIKPVVACGEEMATQARQGGWIADDLAGTLDLAPAGLDAAHEDLTEAVAVVASAAAGACGDPTVARMLAAREEARFAQAMSEIEVFLSGLHMERPGEVPVKPGTAN
jgi:hypothetical protein